LKADPRRVRVLLREACTEGNAVDIFFVCMAPTHRSEGNLRGGGLSRRVCRACGGPPEAHVEVGRGARAARAVDSVVWRGEIRPVAVLQRMGLPDSCLRG